MAELHDKTEDVPTTSAFHPRNIHTVQTITLARIYDLLAVLAINQADDDVKFDRVMTVLEDHENGILRMASPAFRES